MDLKGRKVIHGNFGEGTVTEQDNEFIKVAFEQREIKFEYPNAFKDHLKIEDRTLIKVINAEIARAETEKARITQEKKMSAKVEREKKIQEEQNVAKKLKAKVYPRSNVAFKCNYCDGGGTEYEMGYNGVCSDKIIRYNIEAEKKVWCSSEDSACRQYLQGAISRKHLDALCKSEMFVCYESQMLREWRAFAGVVQTGRNKGRPMKLNKVQPNSLCVLTTRDPNDNGEEERYIFALFLVDETYEGDSLEAGFVTTKSEFKVKFTPAEAKRMLFWNYHANEKEQQNANWKEGLHRYYKDEEAAQILRDTIVVKKGTKDEELAERFFRHFCMINGVDIDSLPKPYGALKMR